MDLPLYIAITGMSHYYGTAFLKPGQLVQLIKDPDNEHDQEAIRAEIPPIGKVGYVANSTYTVPKGCRSAGRVYDTFDQRVIGIVCFVLKDTAIVVLVPDVKEMNFFKTNEHGSFPFR